MKPNKVDDGKTSKEKKTGRKPVTRGRDTALKASDESPADLNPRSREASPANTGMTGSETGDFDMASQHDQADMVVEWSDRLPKQPGHSRRDAGNLFDLRGPPRGEPSRAHPDLNFGFGDPQRSSCPDFPPSDHTYSRSPHPTRNPQLGADVRPRLLNREQAQSYHLPLPHAFEKGPSAQGLSQLSSTAISEAVGQAIKEISPCLREALTDISRTMMETVSKGMSDLTTAASQANVLKTIDGYAAAHPPPTLRLRADRKSEGRSSVTRRGEVRSAPSPRRKARTYHDIESSDSSDNGLSDAGNRRSRHQSRGVRRREIQISSTSESEGGFSPSEIEFVSSRSSQRMNPLRNNIRLPPFTGQEPWTVYYNRFQDVAELEQWSESEKLLLPRLQGKAGEFVYGQLARDARSTSKGLARELKNRFRKIETARTYGAQFSNRNQQANESAEVYAAELKRLYDKAHANRDKQTRREDLLRRFLDGITKDRARFQVEFVKEPENIDQAVYEVVSFMEARKRASGTYPHTITTRYY